MRLIFGEVPTPATNGVRTVFTVANSYQTNSLKVYRNGVLLYRTTDYTETSRTTFTLLVAPDADEFLVVDYVQIDSSSDTDFDDDAINTHRRVITIFSMISEDNPIVKGDRPSITLTGAGTLMRAFTGINMEEATTVTMRVKSPLGVQTTWTMTVDTTNPYYASYTLADDDLLAEGTYLASIEVVIDGDTIKGTTFLFDTVAQYNDQTDYMLYGTTR